MSSNIKINNDLLEVINFEKWLDYKVFFWLVNLKVNQSVLIVKHSEVMKGINNKTRGSSNKCVRKIILGFRELYFETKKRKHCVIEKVEEVGRTFKDLHYKIYLHDSIKYLINAPMIKYTTLNLDVILSISNIHEMRLYLLLSRIIISKEGNYRIPVICDNNYTNSAVWIVGDTQNYRDNPRIIRDRFIKAFLSAAKLFENYIFDCKLNGKMEFIVSYKKIK